MIGGQATARGRARPAWRSRERAEALVATHWPLLAVMGVVVLVGLPTLNFQYGPDQALFAYIGRHLPRGEALYVDVWDVKPPGIFWVYALAADLPSPVRAVRAFDLIYTLATITAVYA